MNRTELQQLADVRIDEAHALLELVPPRPDGAYYLAGYAVECALKAAIAKSNLEHDWPDKQFVSDCHTHNLERLMRLAGLAQARESDAFDRPVFAQHWLIVKDWSENSRYSRHSAEKARKMIDAVVDERDGVLAWIKARW